MATIKRGPRASRLKPTAHPKTRSKYPPDAVRAAFERWTVGPESSVGEQRMFCPVCEDPETSESPSASMNADEGVWNCLKSEGKHGGEVYQLVKDLNLKVSAPAKRIRVDPHATNAPKPLANPDERLEWHDQMMARFPERVEFLTSQRGLELDTIGEFKIGWDGKRYTIPIRHQRQWVNVRRYLPGGEPKMLNLPGHGSNVLAFTERLNGNALPVLLVEGELDAILANQIGADQFVAVTGTGGAPNVPTDLSMLAGREVFVLYDNDEAGRKGTKKIAAALEKTGASVFVLDWAPLNLLPGDKTRKDFTDWVMKLHGTAAQIVAEMERARSGAPAHDEVLAEVERLFLAADDSRPSLIDEVLSDDDVLSLNPPAFVIEGWVPVGFFSDFFGEPGAKKTFAILDMLRCIRAGIPWHGHSVQQGAALLFEGEGLEQLQSRILAWDELNDNPPLAPGGSVSATVDMTTPEGVARVVRTVRDFEARCGEKVVAVAFDPLVEYMTGDESTEGMALVTRGLRALAQYLEIGVIVGAHTNAEGLRARGGDQLRMRAGAHVRVENLKGDLVGLVQEKQKNAGRRALVLMPQPVGTSLALSTYKRLTAAEYYAEKDSVERDEYASRRLSLSSATRDRKVVTGEGLLLDAVRASPGIVRGRLLNTTKGHGIGDALLASTLDSLVSAGRIRVDRESDTRRNAAHRHYIADEPGREP